MKCINNFEYDCGTDDDTCSKANNYINCLANKAKKECGEDGYYYIFNTASIIYHYSPLQCNIGAFSIGVKSSNFSMIALIVTFAIKFF